MNFILYPLVFLYGIVVGSFLNVCILRIPGGESIVTKRSHCTSCGHQLAWYDLFPLFSYLILRGKCRYCGKKISAQYPIVEAANGVIWVMNFAFSSYTVGDGYQKFLYVLISCVLSSSLLVLSVIDLRTFEIPFGINVVIFVLGIMTTLMEYDKWLEHVIGFVAVSGFLYLVYLVTKGRGIGGGDVKLMAASGLLLGWKLSLLSLILGCFFGSTFHIIRMKVSGEGRVLAMGPYLSMGIMCTVWFGKQILTWYLGLFG